MVHGMAPLTMTEYRKFCLIYPPLPCPTWLTIQIQYFVLPYFIIPSSYDAAYRPEASMRPEQDTWSEVTGAW